MICAPFDLARTRLASDMVPGPATFSGFLELWSSVFLQHGLRGFFIGMSSFAIWNLAFRSYQHACFKQIQDFNPYRREPGLLRSISLLVAATLARTVILPLAYPFDTVRCHMFLEAELPQDTKRYHGSVECFFKIINRDGISGLYQRFLFEFLRGFGRSLAIFGYDVLKTYFSNWSLENKDLSGASKVVKFFRCSHADAGAPPFQIDSFRIILLIGAFQSIRKGYFYCFVREVSNY